MICGENRAEKQGSQQRGGIFGVVVLSSKVRIKERIKKHKVRVFAKLGQEQALTEGKVICYP